MSFISQRNNIYPYNLRETPISHDTSKEIGSNEAKAISMELHTLKPSGNRQPTDFSTDFILKTRALAELAELDNALFKKGDLKPLRAMAPEHRKAVLTQTSRAFKGLISI